MSSRSAIEVANWFIANAGGRELTNLKIQKLVYFAFSHHFAVFDKILFYEPIEAWRYGPVVANVYHSLKCYLAGEVDELITLPGYVTPMLKADDEPAICSVRQTLNELGDFSGNQLVGLSHMKGGAWDQVYSPDEVKLISSFDIRDDYYRRKNIARRHPYRARASSSTPEPTR